MHTLSSAPVRILFVHDDPRHVDQVTRALREIDSQGAIRQVDSEPSFLQELERFEPDVVLCNQGVSGFTARQALRATQARRPESAFVMIAADCDQAVIECLKAGAADFVRSTDLSRLGAAITTALQLRVPLRKLSHRQRQVLCLLAAGCSTREIAAQLEVSIKTVETHRAQVMKRLNIRDVASLVRYAVSIGIVPI